MEKVFFIPHVHCFEASAIMAEKGNDGEIVLVGDVPFTEWLRGQVKNVIYSNCRRFGIEHRQFNGKPFSIVFLYAV